MHASRTIFAMGGGDFLSEPADAALERYVLGLAHGLEPRICFLPTASGDPRDAIVRFHAVFDPLPCRPSALDLFRLHGRDLELAVRRELRAARRSGRLGA